MEWRGRESQDAKSLEPDLTRKTFTFWSVCAWLQTAAWLCLYTWTSIHVRAYTPRGLGGCYGPWKATDIVYLSVAWNSSFDSVLLAFWKQLPVWDALASAKWECQSQDYDFVLCPAENCRWCLFIGTPYPFLMVGGKTLSVFGGSYTISCHRKKNASWSPETWSDNLFDLETTI